MRRVRTPGVRAYLPPPPVPQSSTMRPSLPLGPVSPALWASPNRIVVSLSEQLSAFKAAAWAVPASMVLPARAGRVFSRIVAEPSTPHSWSCFW